MPALVVFNDDEFASTLEKFGSFIFYIIVFCRDLGETNEPTT